MGTFMGYFYIHNAVQLTVVLSILVILASIEAPQDGSDCVFCLNEKEENSDTMSTFMDMDIEAMRKGLNLWDYFIQFLLLYANLMQSIPPLNVYLCTTPVPVGCIYLLYLYQSYVKGPEPDFYLRSVTFARGFMFIFTYFFAMELKGDLNGENEDETDGDV